MHPGRGPGVDACPPALRPLGDLQELSGLDVCVGEEVGFEVRPLVEVALTNGTSVGGLVHVEDLVDCQGARLTEALATFRAFEWLLLGVDVAVVSEVVLSAEGLPTDITVVWPLISVGPLMDQEVVGLGELPAAVLADEPLLWS